MIDSELKKHATHTQLKYLEAVEQYGSNRKAARALGVSSTTIDQSIQAVKRKLLLPDGQKLSGTSTLYRDGEKVMEWIKTKLDLDREREIIEQAAKDFYKDLPRVEIPPKPKNACRDIIPWFQIGDAHLGMLAHEAETEANFDLKIAEKELHTAFSVLFDECEPRDRCVINDLGDFTHYENFAGVTEASKNPLDYDGRFPKMISVYSRLMRKIVDKALEKFAHVDVIINQGNHSRTNDIWMAELLRVAYAGSNRVHVLDNSSIFIPYRMGNTFVMVHHSDKVRPNRLVQVMSNNFRQDWGESKFRYIDIGHLHHKIAIEDAGCLIEMWNTLAGKDKYSHDGGYQARQSITRVDRSRTYGEVGRRVLPVEEIRDRLSKVAKDHYIPSERKRVHTV